MSRPRIAEDSIKKVVGITLSKSEWERIEKLIEDEYFRGKSEYFRNLHLAQWVWMQR